MSTNDIAVGSVGLPVIGSTLRKPTYLLKVIEKKSQVCFLSVDRPSFEHGFVLVKGCFINSEDDANQTIEKDSIVEMYFPNHSVVSIKNLVYKAK